MFAKHSAGLLWKCGNSGASRACDPASATRLVDAGQSVSAQPLAMGTVTMLLEPWLAGTPFGLRWALLQPRAKCSDFEFACFHCTHAQPRSPTHTALMRPKCPVPPMAKTPSE